MARERFNSQIARTYKRLGGLAEKKTDMFNALAAQAALAHRPIPSRESFEPGGHPDYLWLMPPYGGWLEVKDGDNNFAFSQIVPKQREWLSDWEPVSWLWLFMGTGRCGTDDRAAYLIPWRRYLETEASVLAAGLRGLAFKQAHAREHRAQHLSVVERFADCGLSWCRGEDAWDIPADHCFWTQPLSLGFLFGYHCERKEHVHPCEEQYAHDQLALCFAQ